MRERVEGREKKEGKTEVKGKKKYFSNHHCKLAFVWALLQFLIRLFTTLLSLPACTESKYQQEVEVRDFFLSLLSRPWGMGRDFYIFPSIPRLFKALIHHQSLLPNFLTSPALLLFCPETILSQVKKNILLALH